MLTILKAWKYALLACMLIALFLYANWANGWKSKEYTIASGQPGAGYYTLVSGMLEVAEKDDVEVKLKRIVTDGSIENIRLLAEKKADFGLIQLGGDVDDDLRAVAHVYDDVVHILTRMDFDPKSVAGFSGKKVASGLPGSGTRMVAVEILGHYGLDQSEIEFVNASPSDSIQMLIENKVDAVILVTAAQAPVIVNGILSGKIKHLSLGKAVGIANEAHGLCMKFHKFKPTTNPKHAYGRVSGLDSALPRQAVSVVSVPSILACRKDMRDEVVYELTRALYANKHVLGKHYNEMQNLAEPKELDAFVYPVHPGAMQYYQRRAPGFLVVYAEVIALLLSVTIALIALISALRQLSAVKHKNRIDEYYKKLNASMKRLQSGEADPLQEKIMLTQLRGQAYDELISEKLYANESFRIFQDLLEQCLEEVNKTQ